MTTNNPSAPPPDGKRLKRRQHDLFAYIFGGLLLVGVGLFALLNGGSVIFGVLLLVSGLGVTLVSVLRWTTLPRV